MAKRQINDNKRRDVQGEAWREDKPESSLPTAGNNSNKGGQQLQKWPTKNMGLSKRENQKQPTRVKAIYSGRNIEEILEESFFL